MSDSGGDDLFADVADGPEFNDTEQKPSLDKVADNDDLFVSAVDTPGLSTIKLDDDSSPVNESASVVDRNSAADNGTVPSATKRTAKPEVRKSEDEFTLQISVSDPEKIGTGMSAFVVYKVVTKTNIAAFRSANLLVKRRFSDFLGLYEKLVAKYSSQCRILPQPPAQKPCGYD